MRDEIRRKVLDLARRRGVKAATLADDEVIPETGLLDSAGIMELIVWLEDTLRTGDRPERRDD